MAAENESILYKKLDVLFLQIESNSINGKIVDKISLRFRVYREQYNIYSR